MCTQTLTLFLHPTASSLQDPTEKNSSFRTSKPHIWVDAITSAPSTCQVPLPALMVAAEWGEAERRGTESKQWTTSCWIPSLPPCANPTSQFISQPPLSSAALGQASQQVSLCRRVLSPHREASLCSNPKWQAATSTT